ncbi:unnamed protein product [Schistocephalus solidus]|uniref:SET domain-containing protein n=1 Tax=Schistocephalus solidus TaxID=70667 RepID=A0A183T371_SCHSO|nr:unnamed protein product [Schistocephalus solidus]
MCVTGKRVCLYSTAFWNSNSMPRHLPPDCESASSGSDWASSGDEWRPSSSPSLPPSSIKAKQPRRRAAAVSSGSTGDSNASTNLSASAKACPVKALVQAKIADCYECQRMVLDACKKHPSMWVENVVVDDCEATANFDINCCTCLPDQIAHAKKTIPSEYVSVRPSGIPSAGLGVWSEREISLGAIFGPYTGEVVYLHSLTPDELDVRFRRGYAWLVRENLIGTKRHIVDATNPVNSNWLRFPGKLESPTADEITISPSEGECNIRLIVITLLCSLSFLIGQPSTFEPFHIRSVGFKTEPQRRTGRECLVARSVSTSTVVNSHWLNGSAR